MLLVNTQAQNDPFFAYIFYSHFSSLVFLFPRSFAVVACIWRWYDSSTRNIVRVNVTMWARNIDAISSQTLCTIIVLYIIITYGVRFSCHCSLFLSRRVTPGAFWRWSRHRFFLSCLFFLIRLKLLCHRCGLLRCLILAMHRKYSS